MFDNVKPKVSICMITYNHAAYIGEAIKGVLSQITSFSVELVIGEDCSTDDTRKVIQQYSGTDKIKIRTNFNKNNIGMQENFSRTFWACEGQYIALLEGDDYWTDPLKLQRQVDFLDANPDFSICFHPVFVLTSGKLEKDTRTRKVADVTNINDLAEGNFMHTCSVVFRSKLFDKFPECFNSSAVGDYFLHMINAQYGLIKCLPQNMGVYRVHDGGVWSAQNNVDLKVLSYLELMIGLFSKEVNSILINRHQRIALSSLLDRVGEPDFNNRLKRCLVYGDDLFCEKLKDFIYTERKIKRSLLNRIVSLLK